MNTRHICKLAFVASLTILAGHAQAASFDCARAGTKVEHLICDTPQLSKLDDELAEAYQVALTDSNWADATRHAQKAWLKERNACSDVACVNAAYDRRLTSLSTSASASDPRTCSPDWLDLLERRCDGSSEDACFAMLAKARRLLESQRKVMTRVLVDPNELIDVERLWNKYRDAECETLEPQCPEGVSGSCNLPSAICEVRMGCERVVHLRTIECRTNSYNRSLEAPPKPDVCN